MRLLLDDKPPVCAKQSERVKAHIGGIARRYHRHRAGESLEGYPALTPRRSHQHQCGDIRAVDQHDIRGEGCSARGSRCAASCDMP